MTRPGARSANPAGQPPRAGSPDRRRPVAEGLVRGGGPQLPQGSQLARAVRTGGEVVLEGPPPGRVEFAVKVSRQLVVHRGESPVNSGRAGGRSSPVAAGPGRGTGGT